MEILGSFTISISDSNLEFSSIEKNIGIQPTKVIKKGQLIGRLENKKAPYDIWVYEIKISNQEDIFVHLANLLNDLIPYSEYIQEISKIYDEVSINCYLRSNYAQIGFELTAEMIKTLQKLGLGINFHILSFGEVEE